jgi:hypothetical protein
MKKTYRLQISHFLYALGFVLLIEAEAAGQPAQPMSLLIRGGNQTATITTGIAGGGLVDVINTSSSLEFDTGNRTRKITVRTSCLSQAFTLKVVATNVTEGVAQPEVTLVNGNPAVDLIRDIGSRQNNETCTLQYTASATFAQGNSTDFGNDAHTVTYTIQSQ